MQRRKMPPKYKKYYGGGKVKYKRYKGGGKNTDTVPAMLTPGEVVLNEDQISSLEQYVGKKRAKIFADIGVPGFRRGGKAKPVEHDEGYPERKETKWGKQFRDIPVWLSKYISKKRLNPVEEIKGLKAYKTKPKMTRLSKMGHKLSPLPKIALDEVKKRNRFNKGGKAEPVEYDEGYGPTPKEKKKKKQILEEFKKEQRERIKNVAKQTARGGRWHDVRDVVREVNTMKKRTYDTLPRHYRTKTTLKDKFNWLIDTETAAVTDKATGKKVPPKSHTQQKDKEYKYKQKLIKEYEKRTGKKYLTKNMVRDFDPKTGRGGRKY